MRSYKDRSAAQDPSRVLVAISDRYVLQMPLRLRQGTSKQLDLSTRVESTSCNHHFYLVISRIQNRDDG